MSKAAKTKAEIQFAATQKKTKLALQEREIADKERAEHVAGLKALRLAKAAVDKETAEVAAAEKAAAIPKKTPRLPQAHRR